MSGGIEDWKREIEEEEWNSLREDAPSNITHGIFDKKALSKAKLVEKLQEMDFDKMVLIGTKDEEVYTMHTGMESLVELTGLLETVKISCIVEKL